jgi:hypothetical protein
MGLNKVLKSFIFFIKVDAKRTAAKVGVLPRFSRHFLIFYLIGSRNGLF